MCSTYRRAARGRSSAPSSQRQLTLVLAALSRTDSCSAPRFSSFFGVKTQEVTTLVKKNADINIFTVASGLLYEVRLLVPLPASARALISFFPTFVYSVSPSSWLSQSCATLTALSSSGSSRTSSRRRSWFVPRHFLPLAVSKLTALSLFDNQGVHPSSCK